MDGRRVIVTNYLNREAGKWIDGRLGTVHHWGDNENWWIINVKGAGLLHLSRDEFRFISPLEELARAGNEGG